MKGSIRILGAVGVAAALTFGAAEQAHAGTIFSQSWGSGAYHASYDFVPSSGYVNLGGRAGSGGLARYFYVQLVKTSGSTKVHSTYSWPANGVTYRETANTYVYSGTSYYLRWYGQDSGLYNGFSAPSATASALRG